MRDVTTINYNQPQSTIAMSQARSTSSTSNPFDMLDDFLMKRILDAVPLPNLNVKQVCKRFHRLSTRPLFSTDYIRTTPCYLCDEAMVSGISRPTFTDIFLEHYESDASYYMLANPRLSLYVPVHRYCYKTEIEGNLADQPESQEAPCGHGVPQQERVPQEQELPQNRAVPQAVFYQLKWEGFNEVLQCNTKTRVTIAADPLDIHTCTCRKDTPLYDNLVHYNFFSRPRDACILCGSNMHAYIYIFENGKLSLHYNFVSCPLDGEWHIVHQDCIARHKATNQCICRLSPPPSPAEGSTEEPVSNARGKAPQHSMHTATATLNLYERYYTRHKLKRRRII